MSEPESRATVLARLKRTFVEELLASSNSVIVCLDATREGVQVPADYRDDNTLVLRLGYNLKPPVPINIDDERLLATLSFKGTAYCCHVPWGAVIAAQSETSPCGFSWPEDGKGPPLPKPEDPPTAPAKFKLRSV